MPPHHRYLRTDVPSRSARLERWIPHFFSTIAIALSLWTLIQTRMEKAEAVKERTLAQQQRVTDLLDEVYDLLTADPDNRGLHGHAADPTDMALISRKIDRTLLLDPTSERAYRYKAAYHTYRSQYLLAVEAAQKAIQLDPKSTAARDALAEVYHAQRDFPRAAAVYQETLRIAPNSVHTLYAFGQLCIQHGDPRQGLPLLQRAASLPDADARVFTALAIGHSITGQPKEAAAAAAKAVEHDPVDANAVAVLGYTLIGDQRAKEAIAAFRRLAQLDPARNKEAADVIAALEKNPKANARYEQVEVDYLSILLGSEHK